MKKIVLAMGVSVLALSASAMAASKDGFYMGLGVVNMENDAHFDHTVNPGGWFNITNRNSINAAPVNDLGTDGYGASIFAGYAMHVHEMVTLGVEVDASVFDGETTQSHTQAYDALGSFTIQQEVSQQWISTIRAKAGIDVGMATLFITGGAAFTDVAVGGTFSDTYSVVANRILLQSGRTSLLASGYVYGGGFDLNLGGQTALRVEYLHHDFEDVTYSRALTFSTGAATGNTLRGTATVDNAILRVGLKWNMDL
jgi:opacity protein-like surface antigen